MGTDIPMSSVLSLHLFLSLSLSLSLGLALSPFAKRLRRVTKRAGALPDSSGDYIFSLSKPVVRTASAATFHLPCNFVSPPFSRSTASL